MAEIFENIFHKRYVGGVGEVVEKPVRESQITLRSQTYEEVLAEYRWYVRDDTAELPREIIEQLANFGKI